MRLPAGRMGARAGGGIGLAGLVVVALLALVFGVDPRVLLEGGDAPPAPYGGEARAPGAAPDDELARFASVVLAETEDAWHGHFARMGAEYREPTLVLFDGAVESACGIAGAAVGPFYCPADGRLYLDLAFYRDLRDRLGAPGDLAQAYVIAHEVGHHVQNLLGVLPEVQAAQRGLGAAEANALSVRAELQADCFAGIWAHDAARRQLLEPGDVEEALGAASAVGDDRLQAAGGGRVVPDSFTHGTSAQRMRWFRRGFEAGDPAACDAFGAETP